MTRKSVPPRTASASTKGMSLQELLRDTGPESLMIRDTPAKSIGEMIEGGETGFLYTSCWTEKPVTLADLLANYPHTPPGERRKRQSIHDLIRDAAARAVGESDVASVKAFLESDDLNFLYTP